MAEPAPDPESLAAAVQATARQAAQLSFDPETVEQDLARLVLGLMELLRELMERQAIRRLDAGALTPNEEQRVGETLMRARAKIREMAAQFGLDEDDLAFTLGQPAHAQ